MTIENEDIRESQKTTDLVKSSQELISESKAQREEAQTATAVLRDVLDWLAHAEIDLARIIDNREH